MPPAPPSATRRRRTRDTSSRHGPGGDRAGFHAGLQVAFHFGQGQFLAELMVDAPFERDVLGQQAGVVLPGQQQGVPRREDAEDARQARQAGCDSTPLACSSSWKGTSFARAGDSSARWPMQLSSRTTFAGSRRRSFGGQSSEQRRDRPAFRSDVQYALSRGGPAAAVFDVLQQVALFPPHDLDAAQVGVGLSGQASRLTGAGFIEIGARQASGGPGIMWRGSFPATFT